MLRIVMFYIFFKWLMEKNRANCVGCIKYLDEQIFVTVLVGYCFVMCFNLYIGFLLITVETIGTLH